MLVTSPVILGFGAALILITDSPPFWVFNISVFFVSLPFGLAVITPSIFFAVLMHLASSENEIREWRKTGQFKLFAWHKLINESEKGREGKHFSLILLARLSLKQLLLVALLCQKNKIHH